MYFVVIYKNFIFCIPKKIPNSVLISFETVTLRDKPILDLDGDKSLVR